MKNTAIVVGGSLGGLTAANLLLRAGWEVKVFERVSNGLESRGAGLVTYPELFDIFHCAGVHMCSRELGIHVEKRVALNRAGQIIETRRYPQIFTAWNKLYDALRRALPDALYFQGHAAVGFEATHEQTTVHFDNGHSETASLIIAADGYKSLFRTTLFPHVAPQYAGYVAWRGMVKESDMTSECSKLFNYFNFALLDAGQIVAYPVAGADNSVEPGRRRFNFVWYRAATPSELIDLSTDAGGKYWQEGIPPPLIRPDVIRRIKQAATEELPSPLAGIVQMTDAMFFQPISDLQCDTLVNGRIALLGDAAFVARPHCGMGVTKAAQDAYQLSISLANNRSVELGLADYQRRRTAFGAMVVKKAQALGAYMQATKDSPDQQAMSDHYADPSNVLADTAMPISIPYQ